MVDKCETCGTDKECMGGRSAHPSNWYCPKCNQNQYAERDIVERDKAVPDMCGWCARAWDMRSCINKLLEAADILLDDYDGIGYEEIDAARKSARAMLTGCKAEHISVPPAAPEAQQQGEVVVTWTPDRQSIAAVTRQDNEGRILSVIAEAPDTQNKEEK